MYEEFGYSQEQASPRKETLVKFARSLQLALKRAKSKSSQLPKEVKHYALKPGNDALKGKLSPILLQLVLAETKNCDQKPLRGR